ncbi:MAG: FAD-dependent oxidoreductase [Spirochaetales bacterium]|nr:FAD-dependent oxidoreductase [Spirochaetales bacterium]
MKHYDCIIVGTGPAGMGAAFHLLEKKPGMTILLVDKERLCSGGFRNDCKMNFTFPVGFPVEHWRKEEAERYMEESISYLRPDILAKKNIDVYKSRAEKIGVTLLDIKQAHMGTDGGIKLIGRLMKTLESKGAEISLGEEILSIDPKKNVLNSAQRELASESIIIAPGRKGFRFLQRVMDILSIPYVDNIVDIGIRVETRIEHYPIVIDYYDPKFIFPDKVRTFCTNSRRAFVVAERYKSRSGERYVSINGHAYSEERKPNGLVNVALLNTVRLSEPLASGQAFAEMLGLQVMLMGGGKPIMQRVGDFRLGRRSKIESFNEDLYDFRPSLPDCTPGDISLSVPAKILRAIWKSMKLLDTIVPGILHPGTIMYYPEIKLYANRPRYMDDSFQVKEGIYLVGDGAGTSRGITAAWASGARAAESIIRKNTG